MNDDLVRRLVDGPILSIDRLSGGNLNYVFRVERPADSVIFKMAPPYVAANPDIPLDPQRLVFEARALALELEHDGVRMPRLLAFHAGHHAVVMEDVGVCPDISDGTRADGAALGSFLRLVHATPVDPKRFDNRDVQRTRHAVQYANIGTFCRAAGLNDAEALGAIGLALGKRFQEPGQCLIMGDLWPPSVLLARDGLRVIDWEFVHFGHPAQDIGHLAAHLYMHACRRQPGALEVLAGFLDAYGPLSDDVRRTASLHFACEVLARSLGPFAAGYLYDSVGPDHPDVVEAGRVAAEHLRGADTIIEGGVP